MKFAVFARVVLEQPSAEMAGMQAMNNFRQNAGYGTPKEADPVIVAILEVPTAPLPQLPPHTFGDPTGAGRVL